MVQWVKVCQEDAISGPTAVDISGKEIVLFRLTDAIYALENTCSHEYAHLSDGDVWEDFVFCPIHGSKFNVRTGAVGSLPATQSVRSFPVKVEDGLVYVDIG